MSPWKGPVSNNLWSEDTIGGLEFLLSSSKGNNTLAKDWWIKTEFWKSFSQFWTTGIISLERWKCWWIKSREVYFGERQLQEACLHSMWGSPLSLVCKFLFPWGMAFGTSHRVLPTWSPLQMLSFQSACLCFCLMRFIRADRYFPGHLLKMLQSSHTSWRGDFIIMHCMYVLRA